MNIVPNPKPRLKRKFGANKRKPKTKRHHEKTLKNKLDRIFSNWVRSSAADKNGYINCYCGAQVPWRDSDASHYIPRGCLALRYDPRNVHPSCRKCNRFMGGNLQSYSLYLERTYGAGILQTLESEKRKITKNFPYQEEIEKYTGLLKDI